MFVDKIANAVEAGYAAVLIANDGFPDRIEPFEIGAEPFTPIPAAMTSSTVGLGAARPRPGQTATFSVDATTTESVQHNLIADTPTGNPERTTVVGAHLDSVEEGPGINDNGSGSGTILEIAEEIAELPRNPRNRIRFAWWGAEEAGLVGSTAYVADLIESGEIDNIEANLNFDMLASPNFVRFVYDGDNSTGEGAAGPPGSAEIEQVFLDHFESAGLETAPTAFDGRSDYGPFIAPEALCGRGWPVLGRRGRQDARKRKRSTVAPRVHGMTRATTSSATRSARSCTSRPSFAGDPRGLGRPGWRKARRRLTPPRCVATARSASANWPTPPLTPRGPWGARRARWSVRRPLRRPVSEARRASATARRTAVRPSSAFTRAVR